MKRVFDVISKYETKFILYTYDSFTFDFNMNEGKELILKIKDAMKQVKKDRNSFNRLFNELSTV